MQSHLHSAFLVYIFPCITYKSQEVRVSWVMPLEALKCLSWLTSNPMSTTSTCFRRVMCFAATPDSGCLTAPVFYSCLTVSCFTAAASSATVFNFIYCSCSSILAARLLVLQYSICLTAATPVFLLLDCCCSSILAARLLLFRHSYFAAAAPVFQLAYCSCFAAVGLFQLIDCWCSITPAARILLVQYLCCLTAAYSVFQLFDCLILYSSC